jgi:hypothetical protein
VEVRRVDVSLQGLQVTIRRTKRETGKDEGPNPEPASAFV